MVKHCYYKQCHNDSRRPNAPTMKNAYGEDVRFLHFPGKVRNEAKARRWIRACDRPRKLLSLQKLTYTHFICSLHFIGQNGPTDMYPDPIAASLPRKQREELEQEFHQLRKRNIDQTERVVEDGPKPPIKKSKKSSLRQIDDDDIFESQEKFVNCDGTQAQNNRTTDMEAAETLLEFCKEDHNSVMRNESDDLEIANTLISLSKTNNLEGSYENNNISNTSTGTQTDNTHNVKSILRSHFVDVILNDTMHYTGVKNKQVLEYIFSIVKTKASHITIWRGKDKINQRKYQRTLSLWEEFLLTLLRNRRGTDIKMTAALFGISTSVASQVYTTWNIFLSKELNFLRRFPSVDQNMKKLPKALKKKNGEPQTFVKGLRTILDATEFRCESPSSPAAQKQLYSSYKNDNTYKLLIGCTPNGYINFTSSLWSGNVSDKELVEKSGFLDLLNPGDKVMADKGFGIRGMLALKKCELILPPKLKEGNLKPRGSTKARRVSTVRIHIERAIRRLKTFHILTDVQKMTQKGYIDHIISVCVSLANLGNPLVT
eukprot:Seg2384.2 transcript_id=Seg2384.2/GoldUCD/mRNA.D3Y31 product="hypothetical protein" protein_id=Seg2384.2/GoldUCD/D3Y31